MAQPSNPNPYPLPNDGGRPKTYPELVRQLSCVCAGGAQIKPSPPPSATVNLGDVIADHAGKLSALTAAYGIMAVIMQMISCIIDVLCALMNPFATIAAMIRLFGVCIPEFILILPQLAIPAKILCLIKVIVAIITYILDVIVPLIADIIQNIQDLIDAITDGNQDAVDSVVFKIVSLLKELLSVLGIMAALDAIILMIKALLDAGFGLPCGGGGGSCSGCGDDQCPDVLQNETLTGNDGRMYILYGPDGFNYVIRFTSASNDQNFEDLRDFFPDGVDYSNTEDTDKVPYTLEVNNRTYIVRNIDSGGGLYLVAPQEPLLDDGYLSSVQAGLGGLPVQVDTNGEFIRFGTDTQSFTSADKDGYLQMYETNASLDPTKNSGTFFVSSVYDGYNVRLNHGDTNAWDGYSVLDPNPHMVWRKLPHVPGSGYGLQYTLRINHDELIRRNMIGLGCHPDVKAAIAGTKNRLPVVDDTSLPTLPDVSGLISTATGCLSTVAPTDVDSQYVLDNYGTMASDLTDAASCISDALGDLGDQMSDYAGEIYPRLVDAENSLFTVDKNVVIVGGQAIVNVTPLDLWGGNLAEDLPAGTVEVEIVSSFGTVSEVEEILDDTGLSTGVFRAALTSLSPGEADVTASIGGTFISDFDDTLDPPDLVKRVLTVEFVEQPAKAADRKPADSREPLGVVRS